MLSELIWEKIPQSSATEEIHRAPIFGGWLVRYKQTYGQYFFSITFVPDDNHIWDLTKSYNKS